MSRTTPRRTRHRHHPSSGGGGHLGHGLRGGAGAGASDYDSDAAHYLSAREDGSMLTPSQVPHRTNTELNLTVLRRYLPSIRSIVSIAANAVVYTFSPAAQSWDKSGVEGTLFVCEQEPLIVDDSGGGGTGPHALPRACMFVLNRKGLNNVIVDLSKVSDCEVAPELLIFKLEEGEGKRNKGGGGQENGGNGVEESDGGGGGGEGDDDPKVLGLWIHADRDDTQQVNASIIQQSWRQIRQAREALEEESRAAGGGGGGGSAMAAAHQDTVGPAMQAMGGRRVSLSDLFGQRHGGGQGNGA